MVRASTRVRVSALVLYLLIAAGSAQAKTWTVAVSGVDPVGPFVFAPDTLNIAYGDTVRWVWVSGEHTTTNHDGTVCGSFNPPHLWNELLTGGNPSFSYVFAPPAIPAVDSTYYYECQIHCVEGMDGLIRIQATGVAGPPPAPVFGQPPFSWGRIKEGMRKFHPEVP